MSQLSVALPAWIAPPGATDAEIAARNEELQQALTPAWTCFRYHPEQARWATSTKRFRVTRAGRRSGKTAGPKREAVEYLISPREGPNALTIVFGAPTQD